MVRSVWSRGQWLAWVALALAGCEWGPTTSAPPAPSQPLEVAGATDQADAAGGAPADAAKELILSLPAEPLLFADAWEQVARKVAATEHHAVLSTERPNEGDPPGRQAELIRRAATRAPTAMIVVPGDPKSLAGALEEVRDRRVPILVMDRPVPVAGKPLPLVTFEPFEKPARELAAAAAEAIKAAGFSAQGPALIVNQVPDDDASRRRLATLQDALKEAGITVLEVVPYQMSTSLSLTESRRPTAAAVDRHKDLALVVTLGDNALSETVNVRAALESDRKKFVVMGLAVGTSAQDMLGHNACEGLIDLQVGVLARRAVEATLALAAGRAVPERTEVPTPFRRATESARYSPPPPEMIRRMMGESGKEAPKGSP